MNEDYKEQISALLDGELSAEESGFLLRRLSNDEQARAQFYRFSRISDGLNRGLPEFCADISGAVMARIADEDVPSKEGRWKDTATRFTGGVAVAASVALAAVMLLPRITADQDAAGTAVAPVAQLAPAADQAVAISPAQRPQVVPASHESSQRWQRLDPEVQQRLNAYLVNHSEHSAKQGAATYVKIAGQESAR